MRQGTTGQVYLFSGEDSACRLAKTQPVAMGGPLDNDNVGSYAFPLNELACQVLYRQFPVNRPITQHHRWNQRHAGQAKGEKGE
jgi:hypothetical protein